MPAFTGNAEVDGFKIEVSADEGAFPEGCTLQATAVPSDKNHASGERVALSRTFDIKVLDKDGNPVQPAEGKKVAVRFAAAQVADANLSTRVYHEDDELPVTTLGPVASAVSEGFSLYTVEFTYGDLAYVVEGDATVPLSGVLASVGLVGEPEDVSVSNPELFSASDDLGQWTITAHQPFESTEWMKVTINGVAYEMWYMVKADLGYADTDPVGVTVSIAKAASKATAPTGKEPTYSGSARELVGAGSAEGGTMRYAVTTENVAPDKSAYAATLPSATNVGTYYVWYMVQGDANHEDYVSQEPIVVTIAEVDKADLNEVIDEAEAFYERIKDDFPDVAKALRDAIDAAKATANDKNVTAEQVAAAKQALEQALEKARKDVVSYFCLSGSGSTWAKGSSDPLTFIFKRSIDDELTYRSFKGAKVDGADVPESAFTKAEGSLVLSLTPAFLETLSVGEHTLTATFDDGSADAKFTVATVDETPDQQKQDSDPAEQDDETPDQQEGETSGEAKAPSVPSSARPGDAVAVNAASKNALPNTGDFTPRATAFGIPFVAVASMTLGFVTRRRKRA